MMGTTLPEGIVLALPPSLQDDDEEQGGERLLVREMEHIQQNSLYFALPQASALDDVVPAASSSVRSPAGLGDDAFRPLLPTYSEALLSTARAFGYQTPSRLPLHAHACQWPTAPTLLAVSDESVLTLTNFSTRELSPELLTDPTEPLFHQTLLASAVPGAPVAALSWSPRTIHDVGKHAFTLSFCLSALSDDHSLRYYHLPLVDAFPAADAVSKAEEPSFRFYGHEGVVNSIDCEQAGKLSQGRIASVSDDGTCRIWVLDQGMEGGPLETIRLNSAGHSVRWHADHPQVLMLGQEEGPPRLYDLREGSVVVNFDSSLSGDVSYDADWSAADGNRIGCVFPEKWLMWDRRAPSQPLEGWEGTYPSSVSGNLQPARRFRFSPKSPDTFAISTSTAVYKFDLPLNRTAEAVPVASNTVGDITWMGSWLVSGNVQQYAMCLAGIRST